MIRLLVLLISGFGLLVPDAFAWGKFGHVTICEIADRNITLTARAELSRLMGAYPGNDSFVEACADADRNPRTRPKEHYANYDRSLNEVTSDDCGATGKCVISAIASDFAVLADRTEPDIDRARALVLLGHWVGDIHQPLHVSFADDSGGNEIRKRGLCNARNLHAVWDNCLVERGVFKMNAAESLFSWRRWTKAYRAADRLSKSIGDVDVTLWKQSEPWQWAAESFDIVRTKAVGYCTMKSGACWYDETRQFLEPDGAPRTIQITQDYFDQNSPTADAQLLKAGVRLAHLINRALDPEYTF
ncbi:MAG: S1/P1 nuclease [Hyphomonas sp.]|uniref:S1/P1 nuclease n=1 Tax=Hyphomonas sp. TaxID=87 RepID=UPI0017C4B08A|nr:S1/P1 nuclease [Hyphomonas sp.]MBA3069888.1 S1/P1 nuclease [Hyphomonas sp.]MBU4063581.1 S1/P1 nuclease [Alphaproteobacteria bacterium]MBU4163268.1 S1/P1 nuclease [Alphaproteobacteria bacterium]